MAAGAMRLLTTGWLGFGFYIDLFVEEKIKGLADSYEIPSSSSSGDWSQINSRLRSFIRGDYLGVPAPSVRAGEGFVGSDTFQSNLAHVFHTYPWWQP